MSNALGQVLMQLLRQVPTLLVCLIAVVAALVYLRRSPFASILVLLGAGLFAMTSVLFAFAFQFVVHGAQGEWGWPGARIGQVIAVLGIVSNCVHAVALGLIVAAAFVGRGRRTSSVPKARSPFA